MDLRQKIYNCDGLKIRVLLWDTAGLERYRPIVSYFYKSRYFLITEAEIIILCYSLNDEASIHNLKSWFHEINKYMD